MEKWKDVVGYEGLYKVSSCGNVMNVISGKQLKHRENGNGYYRIELWKNKQGRKHYIHRLVATAFIENPNDKPEVNHIDGDRSNNHADNLEWVSSGENTRHAVMSKALCPWGNEVKPIIAKAISGGDLIYFCSISDAERALGTRHITDVLKGKRRQAKGYTFSYAERGCCHGHSELRNS